MLVESFNRASKNLKRAPITRISIAHSKRDRIGLATSFPTPRVAYAYYYTPLKNVGAKQFKLPHLIFKFNFAFTLTHALCLLLP